MEIIVTLPRLLLVFLLSLLAFPAATARLPQEFHPLLTVLFVTVFLCVAGVCFAYLAFVAKSPRVLQRFSLVSAILCGLCLLYFPAIPSLSTVPLWGIAVTALFGVTGGGALALCIKAMHDYVFR